MCENQNMNVHLGFYVYLVLRCAKQRVHPNIFIANISFCVLHTQWRRKAEISIRLRTGCSVDNTAWLFRPSACLGGNLLNHSWERLYLDPSFALLS